MIPELEEQSREASVKALIFCNGEGGTFHDPVEMSQMFKAQLEEQGFAVELHKAMACLEDGDHLAVWPPVVGAKKNRRVGEISQDPQSFSPTDRAGPANVRLLTHSGPYPETVFTSANSQEADVFKLCNYKVLRYRFKSSSGDGACQRTRRLLQHTCVESQKAGEGIHGFLLRRFKSIWRRGPRVWPLQVGRSTSFCRV